MTDMEQGRNLTARHVAGWVVLVILAGVVVSSVFHRMAEEKQARQAEKDLLTCTRNLAQIGTAIETYSDDAGQGAGRARYPATLSQLVPRLLETMPTCPTAGRDTYSKGYVRYEIPGRAQGSPEEVPFGMHRGGRSSQHAYTVICTGSHADADLEPGFPQYTSRQGLRTFPVVVRP